MIPDTILKEIEIHFRDEFPREGCGMLVSTKSSVLHWIPCTNVANEEAEFVIDSNEYIKALKKYNIEYIVHSHPSNCSSASEYDIISCNATRIPYLIFAYPSMKYSILEPCSHSTPALLGRVYKFGVFDCFSATQDYYSQIGIDVGAREQWVEFWWEKGLSFISEQTIKERGFTALDKPIKHSLLVFQVNSSVPNHLGIYIEDGTFFHHARNRLSCVDRLDVFWHKFLVGVYGYEKNS